eukprot:snap_masked-scaffold_46-processed-gene-1.66-mRNA-1 protein AED:1.00 eAED:1.00 QI:0/-1/0/0/-1/1/1/0/149
MRPNVKVQHLHQPETFETYEDFGHLNIDYTFVGRRSFDTFQPEFTPQDYPNEDIIPDRITEKIVDTHSYLEMPKQVNWKKLLIICIAISFFAVIMTLTVLLVKKDKEENSVSSCQGRNLEKEIIKEINEKEMFEIEIDGKSFLIIHIKK